MKEFAWDSVRTSEIPRKYTCGHCGKFAPAHKHYLAIPFDAKKTPERYIYICPNCDQPTYFASEYGRQCPGEPYGDDVPMVPYPVDGLYREARRCMTVDAWTAAVLLCRTILMHVAVSVGAPDGKQFIEYVEYLDTNGYITPKNKGWVDYIRRKGNDATHKIDVVHQHEARDLITFTEMLLRLVYEFPSKLPAKRP